MRLQERVAIITGAAGAGIGQATARRFAEEGAHVVISDAHPRRTLEVAQAIASEYGVKTLGVVCDVTSREQVEAMVQQTLDAFGRVDILVNNAGRNILAPVAEMTDEQWHTVIDVCLRGTFYCSRAVLKPMMAQRHGNIVSLSSVAGLRGSEKQAHYCAAKAGIIGFTRALALEVAPYNIRVNAIAPGLIYNEFLRRIYPDEFFDKAAPQHPLGAYGAAKRHRPRHSLFGL
ncbi:MAG: 3-oxoacyl-ACP reductase [Candidatus Tectimicrobiota bacterium]|nr:MAG: 3-oxoacyl-ACP reductase [Candidatus Tectomicrobia bacterium]